MALFEECEGDIVAMDSARTIFIRGSSPLIQGSFKKKPCNSIKRGLIPIGVGGETVERALPGT